MQARWQSFGIVQRVHSNSSKGSMRVSILHPTGGQLIAEALQRRGHTVCEDSPDVGYVRTCTYPPWRERSLRRLEELRAARIPSLPSFRDSKFYDNKRLQVHVLRKWMPRTAVYIEPPFIIHPTPFVSKSAEGASSRNVRLIRDHNEAVAEVDAVFGEYGLKIHHGVQRGYLIWQEFVPGNDHDIRVVINGDRLYGLWRYNRKDVPFASGSGNRAVIYTLAEPHVRAAFEMALEIADTLGTRWACFDFVTKDGKPLVLEISFSWNESAYVDCPIFDRDLKLTRKLAVSWPDFAVDELERLVA